LSGLQNRNRITCLFELELCSRSNRRAAQYLLSRMVVFGGHFSWFYFLGSFIRVFCDVVLFSVSNACGCGCVFVHYLFLDQVFDSGYLENGGSNPTIITVFCKPMLFNAQMPTP
jgi:hypothetical protein